MRLAIAEQAVVASPHSHDDAAAGERAYLASSEKHRALTATVVTREAASPARYHRVSHDDGMVSDAVLTMADASHPLTA